MSITASATLIKDYLGTKIPQWWDSVAGAFVEVSDLYPLPVLLNARKSDGSLDTLSLSSVGKLETVSQPYGYAIAEGDIVGHTIISRSGERVAITTSPSDIGPLTATTIPIPPDAGSLISIVSTSGEDKLTTGTGIQCVNIHYIDPSGAEQNIDVEMNGTTIVDTGILMRYVNSMHAESVGSTGSAVGNITAYLTGTAGTVYRNIIPLTNSDLCSDFMVPAGYTMYITNWDASCAGTGKPVAIRLRGTFDKRNNILTPRIFHTQRTVYLETAGENFTLPMPIKVPALSIVKITAFASQAGPYVSGGFAGWMEIDE